VTVLETGETDVAQGHRGETGELRGHPRRVGAGFLDPEEEVLALAVRLEAERFFDAEILRPGPQAAAQDRGPGGSPPVGQGPRRGCWATGDDGSAVVGLAGLAGRIGRYDLVKGF